MTAPFLYTPPGLQSALPPFDIRGLSEISFFLEGQDRPRPPPMATCPSWIYLLYFFSGSKYLAILQRCLKIALAYHQARRMRVQKHF